MSTNNNQASGTASASRSLDEELLWNRGADAASLANAGWRRALPLGTLLLVFLAASSVTWRQPVTSIEMNRNDAGFYLVLAKNIAEHGVYSHQQQPPFQPHTEWPPGVPLLYSIPMSFVNDAALDGGRLWIHGFTLLISSLALMAVYFFVRQRESVAVAIAVTAVTMSSHAFLDSAQAATADTIAVAAAFFALLLLERSHISPTARQTRNVFLTLACVPLIKPYLGMLFPAYLASLFQQRCSLRQRWQRIVLVGVCCLPFAAFVGYSVIAARHSGTISALTWFTTDNPIDIREATGAADTKTATDWLQQSAATVRFHLIYHTVTAPLPWLSWCGLADWNLPARLLVLSSVCGLIGLGAWRSWKQRDVIVLSYTASMLAFFVVFACDNARFFTVLTPMFALLFCRGLSCFCDSMLSHLCNPTRQRGRTLQETLKTTPAEMSKPVTREAPALADASGYMAAVLVASALLATGFWVQHRAGPVHDPSHFYNDLYAALVVVRHDPTITELRVPYQMREIARLETGKRIDVGGEVSHAGVARLTFRPREAPLQKRYARYLTSDEAAQTDGLWKYHRIWDSPSQQVSLERLEPQLALECPGPTELSQRSHDR